MPTLITVKQPNIVHRVLAFLDVFKFLPTPVDNPVSTRQSIIGSLLFFLIFGTFVIVDFITFLTFNKPTAQIYNEPLDENIYKLPDFALAFMTTK